MVLQTHFLALVNGLRDIFRPNQDAHRLPSGKPVLFPSEVMREFLQPTAYPFLLVPRATFGPTLLLGEELELLLQGRSRIVHEIWV
jgi:hypothetical protein